VADIKAQREMIRALHFACLRVKGWNMVHNVSRWQLEVPREWTAKSARWLPQNRACENAQDENLHVHRPTSCSSPARSATEGGSALGSANAADRVRCKREIGRAGAAY
jgi:hypothetical protein